MLVYNSEFTCKWEDMEPVRDEDVLRESVDAIE